MQTIKNSNELWMFGRGNSVETCLELSSSSPPLFLSLLLLPTTLPHLLYFFFSSLVLKLLHSFDSLLLPACYGLFHCPHLPCLLPTCPNMHWAGRLGKQLGWLRDMLMGSVEAAAHAAWPILSLLFLRSFLVSSPPLPSHSSSSSQLCWDLQVTLRHRHTHLRQFSQTRASPPAHTWPGLLPSPGRHVHACCGMPNLILPSLAAVTPPHCFFIGWWMVDRLGQALSVNMVILLAFTCSVSCGQGQGQLGQFAWPGMRGL